jgi:hypothetical protein
MAIGIWNRIYDKIWVSSDEELQTLLNSLSLYDHEENYSVGVSVNDLEQAIKREIEYRSMVLSLVYKDPR